MSGGHLPGVLWDERTLGWRAPAYLARALTERASTGPGIAPPLPWADVAIGEAAWQEPPLRDYQKEAVDAWEAFGRLGVVVLPTGGGKTRVAVAAMSRLRKPAAVLCPTRALLDQWTRELGRWYRGEIGVVGDGQRRIEPLTVLTFESAYRQMDTLGDRFALIVVDEVHHFGAGSRDEALEMCAAPMRLGLTATAPSRDSAAAARLAALVGPTVCEVALGDLVGAHLADFEVVRISVRMSAPEERAYVEAYAPFAELRRAFSRANPEADWLALVGAVARSAAGRAALRGFHRAGAIAAMPEAKRRCVSRLLERHRDDKVLVFAATADDALTLAHENLLPLVTAETARRERERILARFREGSVRAVVSARVLNEGIDVPDARVALLAGGALGIREVVQRVGRVLRPAPGKRAVVYELTTTGTLEDRRAQARRRWLAPRCAAFA